MTRVVLDTNVFVSAAIKRHGAEAAILELAISGELTLCVSPQILEEYRDVLLRPKLRLEPDLVLSFLRFCYESATVVYPSHAVSVSRDEPDNRFLECCEAAQADYLVTGNKRHFPNRWREAQVLNARELLAILLAS
jgi:uncharacterized protein